MSPANKSKIFDEAGEELCYTQLRNCTVKEASQRRDELARHFNCHPSTIARAALRHRKRVRRENNRGRDGADDNEPEDGDPPPDASPVTVKRNDGAVGRSAVAGCSYRNQEDLKNGAFARFLTSIGVEPSLAIVFYDHGFHTEEDLQKLVKFPARTLDNVLEQIKLDGRLSLKDWAAIHAALRR